MSRLRVPLVEASSKAVIFGSGRGAESASDGLGPGEAAEEALIESGNGWGSSPTLERRCSASRTAEQGGVSWRRAIPASIGPKAVHVWRIPTAERSHVVARSLAALPAEERARARRFVFDEDRGRFVTTRWFLRRLLGHYLRCSPLAIAFRYGGRGKPALREPAGVGIWFNVSHSGAWSLIALAATPSVGVDVEWVREDVDALGVADFAFAPGERSYLRGLPASERVWCFFRCWTQKEAYLKANGAGLSIPLDSFEVELAEPPGLRSIRGDEEWARGWRVCVADPAPDHVGAVVVEGAGWDVRFFDGSTLPPEGGLSGGQPLASLLEERATQEEAPPGAPPQEDPPIGGRRRPRLTAPVPRTDASSGSYVVSTDRRDERHTYGTTDTWTGGTLGRDE